MPHARFRTVLILTAALADTHSSPAHAQVPAPDELAKLQHRLERAPRVRTLTLTGFVEAERVAMNAEGLTYFNIVSTTPRNLIQGADTVRWDTILGVDAQVDRAGRTAAGLGALLGFTGLIVGIGTDIVDGSSNVAFPAAALGAASGAILGAVIGSKILLWDRVYPLTSAPGTPTQHVVIGRDSTHSAQPTLIAIAPLANFTGRTNAAKESEKIRDGIVQELTHRSKSRMILVQALAETDRRILEASPNASAATRLPPSEICRSLGADAVVMGAITGYRHSKAEADFVIYEGASGKRVWRQGVNKGGKAIGATIAEAFPPKPKSASRK